MKFLFTTAFLSAVLLSSISVSVNAQGFNLNDHKWKDRVLLIFSPNTYTHHYRDQVRELKSAKNGIQERDLKVYHILQESSASVKGEIIEGEETDPLLSEFDVSPSEYTVILIGKDGTEKLRTNETLSARRLFKEIDAMPMRKLEMKEKGEKN